MTHQEIELSEGDSKLSKLGSLVVSLVTVGQKKAKVIVGRPGLPNSAADLEIGGATIFETPSGLFEVRLLRASGSIARLLITEIAPRAGIAAGFVDQDVENAPFTSAERERLTASLESMRTQIAELGELSAEQIEFVASKLKEMDAAAGRLGRKDWINWALGTLTSVAVTAAFDPHGARALFKIAGSALSWIVGGSIKLLT